jgi:hypothetical protein
VKFFGATTLDDWRRPSVIALILANLIPVFGVLMLGWQIFPIILLFWTESIIVGIFCMLQLLLISNPRLPDYHYSFPKQMLGKIFSILFFALHFGAFTYVQGMAVMFLFDQESIEYTRLNDPDLMFYSRFNIMLHTVTNHHLTWAVIGIFISHAVSFFSDYIGKGQYRRATGDIIFRPYTRIGVMQITVLGSAFFIFLFKAPVWGLLLLIMLKIHLDLSAHLKEQRKMG